MKQKLLLIALLTIILQLVIVGPFVYPLNWYVLPFLALTDFLAVYFYSTLTRKKFREIVQQPSQLVDPTLRIAHETLPYLRMGLNESTALSIADIIQKISEVPAVAITDTNKVLAYLGAGCEHHNPGTSILTAATHEVIRTGQMKIVKSREELNCMSNNCNCPIAGAVIVPLRCRDEVVGSLKLYQTEKGQLSPSVIKLATGIGQLLSLQMELSEIDRQAQLLTAARLDALQAQINPHFFFNTLNTITLYMRTNPERARRLLINLAEFFRRTLKRQGYFTTLREELDTIHVYLILEKARFGPKLQIIQDVDEGLLDCRIPFLCLQPLVENAVKHGITPKEDTGAVKISAAMEENNLVLTVEDNGVGIPADKIDLILLPGYGSGNGVGLSNVHERLKSLYGEQNGLQISSQEGQGTRMRVIIPLELQSQLEQRFSQEGGSVV